LTIATVALAVIGVDKMFSVSDKAVFPAHAGLNRTPGQPLHIRRCSPRPSAREWIEIEVDIRAGWVFNSLTW
jgi:hypothetical protein